MADLSVSAASPAGQSQKGKVALRWSLYTLLCLFALFYLLPLFVMITTSLKSLDEIRTGDLISLPREVTFDAWRTPWSTACTGIQCEGVRPYFWHSVLIAIPGGAISNLVGGDERLCRGAMPVSRRKYHLFADVVWLLHPVSGGSPANGSGVGDDGNCRHYSGFDLCPCDLWAGLHHLVFPQLLRVYPGGSDQGCQSGRRRIFPHLLVDLPAAVRSEEHTSELQSLTNTVCRPLH